MSKHTPGPWEVMPPLGPGDMAVRSDKVNAGGNFYVAVLPNAPHAESDANAALIAAAPDLLACVNMVLDAGDDNGDMGDIDWDMLRAAIAKAEGGAV